jgi:hypothetical protein
MQREPGEPRLRGWPSHRSRLRAGLRASQVLVCERRRFRRLAVRDSIAFVCSQPCPSVGRGGTVSPCCPAATQQRRNAELHPCTEAGSGRTLQRQEKPERSGRGGSPHHPRRVADGGKSDGPHAALFHSRPPNSNAYYSTRSSRVGAREGEPALPGRGSVRYAASASRPLSPFGSSATISAAGDAGVTGFHKPESKDPDLQDFF